MECHSPISIRDPVTKDPRIRITVPCGKCMACLANRRSEWVTRLEQEKKDSNSSHFLTLTYATNPTTEEGIPTLSKRDVQLFMKRLRKALKGQKIKYYLVGEYGSKTLRPHYHALVFGLPYDGDKLLKLIMESWQNGFVQVGTVTSKSISYTLKYMMQPVEERKRTYGYVQLPFALMSKGLGSRYISNHEKWHKKDVNRNYVVKEGGAKSRLPRYYREKIYSKYELDKQRKNRELRRDAEMLNEYESKISALRETYYSRELEELRNKQEQKADYIRRTRKKLKNNDKL